MKTVLALFLTVFCAGLACAADGVASGTVTYFVDEPVSGTEYLFVRLSTETNATCATATRFALPATNASFKTIASMILSAYLSGASMYINGAGTCTASSGSEDLQEACYAGGC